MHLEIRGLHIIVRFQGNRAAHLKPEGWSYFRSLLVVATLSSIIDANLAEILVQFFLFSSRLYM